MKRMGLIGGTGLDHWGEPVRAHELTSDYGQPSSVLAEYDVEGLQIFFLPRHGTRHTIPPHAVNYRANIDLLRQMDVDAVLAVNAVGGIASHYSPGALVIPDQLIDYTWGRNHSFSMGADDDLQHVEFTHPFSANLSTKLAAAANRAGVEIAAHACLAVTQGPRLETAAEVRRLGRDGCDLVGMTTMPEAALAREAGLDYACLCVVANRAAGLDSELPSMEAIEVTLTGAMLNVRKLLTTLFEELSDGR